MIVDSYYTEVANSVSFLMEEEFVISNKKIKNGEIIMGHNHLPEPNNKNAMTVAYKTVAANSDLEIKMPPVKDGARYIAG